MRFLVVFVVVLFFEESFSACDNKNALSSVDVVVHKQRNAKGINLTQHNFHLLDDYMFIDANRANVTQLCEGMIKNFPRLESLTLINVNLSIIDPGTFQNVPKLKHLSLSVNHLATIPRGVFDTVRSLRVIYLTKNQIATIEDGAFSHMPELKAVHLDHNRITHLTGNIFSGSPKVSLINFSYNSLKGISKSAFKDLRPGNNTRELNIDLRKNEIVELDPEALKGLVPVNLHLESNKITRISDTVFSVKEGSSLYFTNNLVGCVADDVVEWLQVKNIVVDLKSNPVDCQCIERIEKELLIGEMRGELNIESTLPCQVAFPFFGNTL